MVKRAEFQPSHIDIDTINVSTLGGEYRFATGPMALKGKFIVNHGQGGYSTLETDIRFTHDQQERIMAVVTEAVNRQRDELGPAFTGHDS